MILSEQVTVTEQRRTASNYLSFMVLILSVAYTGIALVYLVIDPTKWFTRDWRFSILGTPYAPVIHDLLLYAIFSILLYKRVGKWTWLGVFITWFGAEGIEGYFGFFQWNFYYSVDHTFYIKLAFFGVGFIISLLLARRMNMPLALTKLNLFLITTFFIIDAVIGLSGSNINLDFTGNIIYLSLMYLIVGNVKWPYRVKEITA